MVNGLREKYANKNREKYSTKSLKESLFAPITVIVDNEGYYKYDRK